MNPNLMQQIATAHRGELERSVRAGRRGARNDRRTPPAGMPERRRSTALTVWVGYRLIGVGAWLVRPDLAGMPRPRTI